MTTRGKFYSKEVIESWPEIFGEVQFNQLPLRYIQSIIIKFNSGNTWTIPVTSAIKTSGWMNFERSLLILVKDYEGQIDTLEFKLETARLKKDIQRMTTKFLKKKKII